MQVGVLLEVVRLEVVRPQDPEVLLDQVGAFFLDGDGALLEDRIVAALILLLAAAHGLGLDAGLGGVVDATRQVAVGVDDARGLEPSSQGEPHASSFGSGSTENLSPRPRTVERGARRGSGTGGVGGAAPSAVPGEGAWRKHGAGAS